MSKLSIRTTTIDDGQQASVKTTVRVGFTAAELVRLAYDRIVASHVDLDLLTDPDGNLAVSVRGNTQISNYNGEIWIKVTEDGEADGIGVDGYQADEVVASVQIGG